MTAEEYLKENCCNIMDEITGEFIMDTYEVTAKQMTDYLNSQRETIFKEVLEERLPSAKEIDNNAPCNPDASKEDVMAHNWFIGGAEWLIQYLQK